MFAGNWSRLSSLSPEPSALPTSRPSKTPPDIRRVTKCRLKKSRAGPSMRVAASKLFLGTVVVAWLFTGWLFTASAWAQMVGESSDLERVLGQMDAAARNFKAIETEKGKIYFRRDGGEVQMAVDFADPEKYVRYRSGKVQVYLPKMDEVDEYNPGKNRADVESYLVLGFGGSGHDLFKSYDVRFVGMEDANGVKAEKLELIPKSDRLRNDFVARIFLWIDPARGISVQQQFFEPGGNYRLV